MPISVHTAELRLVKRLQLFSQIVAFPGALTGSAPPFGSAFGIEILKSVFVDQGTSEKAVLQVTGHLPPIVVTKNKEGVRP